MKKSNKFLALIPIMFGFFVMGFCDLIGKVSNDVQNDLQLTDASANFLSTMLFMWFFVLSVPVGILMTKIGRKRTVLLSMIVTCVAMLIPLMGYTYTICLIAFAVLGIGNTILQVSLNPLVANVVSGKGLTSALTAGQFIKAISSFVGPLVVAWAALQWGDWRAAFPIYAVVSLLAGVWLMFTKIPQETGQGTTTSFGSVFKLLGDSKILLLFFGILFVVGIDVGINITSPKLLIERAGLTHDDASKIGPMTYFAFRTIGAFIGAFLLTKLSGVKFFRVVIIATLAVFGYMYFATGKMELLVCFGAIGFLCANIFSIIFSAALQHLPSKGNEVSSLMIMGVSGGAIFPLLMGFASDGMNGQVGAVIILAICALYLIFASFKIKEAKA